MLQYSHQEHRSVLFEHHQTLDIHIFFGGIIDLKIKLFTVQNLKQVLARYVTEAGISIVSIVAKEKQPSEILLHPFGSIKLPLTFTFSKTLFDRWVLSKYCNSFNDMKFLFANIVPMGLKFLFKVTFIRKIRTKLT